MEYFWETMFCFSQKTMTEPLTIIIPVYNEGEIILETLTEIKNKINIPHNILIIYDYDRDNTITVLESYLATKKNITLLKNQLGQGALNAIKTGLNQITNGYALVVMADLSDDLAKVDQMYYKMSEGYEIICGSRYMKGGKQIGGPRFKKFLSRMAGLSIHFLAGIPTHDITNSFKMYSHKVLQNISIESNGGFELGMELVIKAHIRGYPISEVPSVWRDRTSGKSNFKLWSWIPKYLKWYFLALKSKIKPPAKVVGNYELHP